MALCCSLLTLVLAPLAIPSALNAQDFKQQPRSREIAAPDLIKTRDLMDGHHSFFASSTDTAFVSAGSDEAATEAAAADQSEEEVLANPNDLDLLSDQIKTLQTELKRLTDAEAKRTADEKKAKETPSDKWSVKLGGHVQLDYINWADAAPSIPNTHDYFEFRRLRLVADGTGYQVCDFRLQMTLEPETIGESQVGLVTSPEVKDAYFSMNEIPFFGRVRIGNFFVPFSLEQVTNDTNNIFLERSIPSQGVFAVDREVGIAAYNCTEDKNLTWTYGVFFDSISESIKERVDDNQGVRVSGRLTWLPWYDDSNPGRSLIHTGVGILYTHDQDGRVRFRARPQIREGPRIIDSGILNADSYTTGNVEFALVSNSFTIQSEAFLSQVDMTTTSAQVVNGAYVHMSYFLTGENRVFERFGQHGAQFGRNVPKKNFRVTSEEISPGALEAKVRWSNLNLREVSAGEYNDITTGFNWYWSDRTRIMFDWIHPVTSSQSVFGSTQSDILAMRFDFNW